jgi:type IV pilus assembly protein PilV
MTPWADDRGFTLLELLVGVTMFVLGIMALYKLQMSTLRTNAYSRDLTEALTLAQDRVEKLMALPYDAADLGDTNGDGVDGGGGDLGLDQTITNGVWTADGPPGNHGNRVPAGTDKYTICWNVAPNYPIDHAKTVRVIVLWRERGGVLHRSSLDFIKAETF